ncbi:hypothetical protein [Paludisphaera soli]|uniref:hypothetical protein n=1 Tax=Paludisphaera soli TaxID=2712865 RepID=UPI0013EE2734|nr:hypothetical protein [Paludisphaera soli]
MRQPVSPLSAWLILTLGLAGCGSPPMVQVETVVHSDGSCDRSIWQPRDQLLPDGALQPPWNARWSSVADAAGPPAFPDEGSARTGIPYFHARGSFAAPEAIPSHFRKSIEGRPEFGASELTRSLEREDFGLFAEYRWRETVTNNVTRHDFEEARDALLDVGQAWAVAGARSVYGAEFDVSAAISEFDRRGRPFFRDLFDAWYAALAAGDAESASRVLSERFVLAVERQGVGLYDANGAVVSAEEGTRRIREHLAGRIAATFRRRDGTPPTAEQVEAVLASPSGPPYASAWSTYLASRKEEFEAKIVPLLVRTTGFYAYPPFLQPPGPRFAFSVRLPGEVVVGAETNGEVEAEGRVNWRFDSGRLFPGGFAMTARSVEIDAAAQRRLFGRLAFPDARSVQGVRDLLAEDPGLVDVVLRAARAGDPRLLDPASEQNEGRKMRLARLKELVDKTP